MALSRKPKMNTPTLPVKRLRAFGRRLTTMEQTELREVLKANGMEPCNHHDCNPKEPSCATNYVYLRAKAAIEAAYRLGLGHPAAVDE